MGKSQKENPIKTFLDEVSFHRSRIHNYTGMALAGLSSILAFFVADPIDIDYIAKTFESDIGLVTYASLLPFVGYGLYRRFRHMKKLENLESVLYDALGVELTTGEDEIVVRPSHLKKVA